MLIASRPIARSRPIASDGRSWIAMSESMAVVALVIGWRWSNGTGSMQSIPWSGSRNMPLAQLLAAALGLPGRMMTVGNRAARPSTKPLRA